MLLSGVIANFYYGRNWPTGGKGPAIAWFCFSSYWYIVAFFGLLHIVRVQYTKLAQLAENTDAKKALLPLRIAIVTIFTLWICYPIVWIIGDQGIGLLSFSTVECIHAFCDIVAKSAYGFTLLLRQEAPSPTTTRSSAGSSTSAAWTARRSSRASRSASSRPRAP
jgi:bacteriorhodopsin